MLRRPPMLASAFVAVMVTTLFSVHAFAQPAGDTNAAAVPSNGNARPSSSAFSTIVEDGSSILKADAAGMTALSTDLVADSNVRTVASSGPIYTDAPVPDEDMMEPLVIADPTTHVRPDFFHRVSHQTSAAQDESTSVNEHRRGHGSAAAGLALAVPLY